MASGFRKKLKCESSLTLLRARGESLKREEWRSSATPLIPPTIMIGRLASNGHWARRCSTIVLGRYWKSRPVLASLTMKRLLEPNLFGRGCPTLTVHMLHFHWPLTLPKTPLLNPALRRMSGTPPCLRRGTQSGTKLPISDTQRGTHRPKMFRPSKATGRRHGTANHAQVRDGARPGPGGPSGPSRSHSTASAPSPRRHPNVVK